MTDYKIKYVAEDGKEHARAFDAENPDDALRQFYERHRGMVREVRKVGNDRVGQDHATYTQSTIRTTNRPDFLPLLTEHDFVKAKYSHKDKRCYTARLLDIFLQDDEPYVQAYKEFRLMTMDVLYEWHSEDHATTGAERAAVFNEVARRLGYVCL